MAKKLKDTDYLFISTYLRAREKNLLTAARMERMIDAPSADEAGKVLQENFAVSLELVPDKPEPEKEASKCVLLIFDRL